MAQRAFGIQTPLAHEFLDEGMVDAAGDQCAGPEVIKARITAMGPVGPVRLHHENHGRTVRVLLTGEAGQLDDDMGFVNDTAQQIGRTFGGGGKSFEILSGLEDHLLSGHRPTGMSTHPVGKNRHQGSLAARVSKNGGPVLLFGTITGVLGDAGFSLIAFFCRYRIRRRQRREGRIQHDAMRARRKVQPDTRGRDIP